MKIRESDYKEILDYMIKQRWEGNELIAFPNDSAALGKEDLFCFPTMEQAKEYGDEMSTSSVKYEYLGIRSLYRTMSEALLNKSLCIETAGLIDLFAMVNRRTQRLEQPAIIMEQNNKVMNQKNLEYLTDQVKYTGFGDDLANDLKMHIGEGKDDFKLNHSVKYGEDTVDSTLNFSKSKTTEMYFFNSYDAKLQKEGSAENLEQTFYINKGSNITLKEAYNLMEGRAVNKDLTNKEGEKYNVWIQMDVRYSDEKGNFALKKYSENYGYDLEAALSKHPIKELQRDDFKGDLIDSLKKGNVQSVNFQVDGTEQKHFVEAAPKFKTVNVYDESMQKLGTREAKSEKQSEGESQSSKKNNKQGTKASDDDAPDAANKKETAKKKRGQTI